MRSQYQLLTMNHTTVVDESKIEGYGVKLEGNIEYVISSG